jgi:hypothetical protein
LLPGDENERINVARLLDHLERLERWAKTVEVLCRR